MQNLTDTIYGTGPAMFTVKLKMEMASGTVKDTVQGYSERHLEEIQMNAREMAPVGSTLTVNVKRNW